jgi:hypothetical protein
VSNSSLRSGTAEQLHKIDLKGIKLTTADRRSEAPKRLVKCCHDLLAIIMLLLS